MTSTIDRRSFLKKSILLPWLAFLTGFKPHAQGPARFILYARRLPPNFSANRTHIFSLNSTGGNSINRYTPYEPAARNAFYYLRDHVSKQWNPLCKDAEEGLITKGIELYRIPKKFLTGTWGCAVAYAQHHDALDNLQTILTRLEMPTDVKEL